LLLHRVLNNTRSHHSVRPLLGSRLSQQLLLPAADQRGFCCRSNRQENQLHPHQLRRSARSPNTKLGQKKKAGVPHFLSAQLAPHSLCYRH
jgi:hypothetical protein